MNVCGRACRVAGRRVGARGGGRVARGDAAPHPQRGGGRASLRRPARPRPRDTRQVAFLSTLTWFTEYHYLIMVGRSESWLVLYILIPFNFEVILEHRLFITTRKKRPEVRTLRYTMGYWFGWGLEATDNDNLRPVRMVGAEPPQQGAIYPSCISMLRNENIIVDYIEGLREVSVYEIVKIAHSIQTISSPLKISFGHSRSALLNRGPT